MCSAIAGWTYKRPEDWGGTCRAGNQSPIDIPDDPHGGADSIRLRFYYPVIDAWMEKIGVHNTGTALAV